LSLTKYGLPPFKDKDDRERDMARLRWWVRESELLRDLGEIPSRHYPMIPEDLRIKGEDLLTASGSTLVVYGHYWRKWGRKGQAPIEWKPLEGLDWTPTTACVDFSAVRGGPLVAYQWDQGDTENTPSRFIAHREPHHTQELANSSEFPIFGNEVKNGTGSVGSAMFHRRQNDGQPAFGSSLFNIRGWHPDAQTEIEKLRPCHRGSAFRDDPLWILHELDRVDKHRLLHKTIAGFFGTAWNLTIFRMSGALAQGQFELRWIAQRGYG
jgi:hypothetical protein